MAFKKRKFLPHPGSDVAHRSKEEAEEIAASMELVAMFPLPDELFVDWDNSERSAFTYCHLIGGEVRHVAPVVRKLFYGGLLLTSELWTKSKSGNWHLYLRTDRNIIPHQKPLLQAVLGSDPVKEMLTGLRIDAGTEVDAAICLFETTEEALRVEKWRQGKRLNRSPLEW